MISFLKNLCGRRRHANVERYSEQSLEVQWKILKDRAYKLADFDELEFDIQALLLKSKDAAKVKDLNGELPIHHFLHCASVKAIHALFQANPSAACETNRHGQLPLQKLLSRTGTILFRSDAYFPPVVTAMNDQYEELLLAVLKAHPGAAEKRDAHKVFPLEIVIRQGASVRLVGALVQAHPDATNENFNYFEADRRLGAVPLHWALSHGASEGVILALLDAHPAAAKENMHFDFGLNGSWNHYSFEDEDLGHGRSEWEQKKDRERSTGCCIRAAHGKLPLQVALEVGGSERVVWELLKMYPEALDQIRLTLRSCIAIARTQNTFGDLSLLAYLVRRSVSSLTHLAKATNIVTYMNELKEHSQLTYGDLRSDVGHILGRADFGKVLGVLHAWHRGCTLQRDFIKRCMGQVIARPASHLVVQFLFGDCPCERCANRAQISLQPGTVQDSGEPVESFDKRLHGQENVIEEVAHNNAELMGCPKAAAVDVIQTVVFDEDAAPASFPSDEAEAVAEQLWASGVEHRIQASSREAQRKIDTSRRLRILTFSRHPQELESTILCCPLVQAFIDQGLNPKPDWANGAKILTPDVCPERLDIELCPRHVIVAEVDEEMIMELLEKMPYNQRPRLKPGAGRAAVPSQTSLFQDLSEMEDSETWSSGHPSAHLSDEDNETNTAPLFFITQDLPIRHTFIDFPMEPVITPRTSRTI